MPRFAVAVDVGKRSFALSVTDAARRRLLGPVECAMQRRPVRELVGQVARVVDDVDGPVHVGVESAGHYHWPLIAPGVWPPSWQVREFNPAHVAAQRNVMGRRTVKTDAIDLEAIAELLLAGRGQLVPQLTDPIAELRAWVTHRDRRVLTRTTVKNQLLAQMDRAFPGLTIALPNVLDTKVGRLLIAEFTDPARLAWLGASRFIRFAAARNVRVTGPLAERLVDAARDALPTRDSAIARQVLAVDLQLLNDLDSQVAAAEGAMTALLPSTPYRTLSSVPGWGLVRVCGYGAARGEPDRWPGPKQLYRAAGLIPTQYESAGKRNDTVISREGSVPLRRALIQLGIGLWARDLPSKQHAAALRVRGKHGGVIICALAHRANRIAFALVRDQEPYDPARWTVPGSNHDCGPNRDQE
jgi:transposase